MRAATAAVDMGGAVDSAGWLLITKTPFATRDYSRRNFGLVESNERVCALFHSSPLRTRRYLQNYRILRSVFRTRARSFSRWLEVKG
jgi:hypothetical protein